ncbi:histidine kinase [Sanguibacter sp. HDW7]|uniref:sensor histidine kinase n=1 Tax=Sanguibacter sp. HDW7 TaxID=2714931 RepID=UPI0014096751|nr:histidine kinase [Sanguibacter sp. HDW7]QIK83943.1 hypothetical protein G7063_10145 [Sanguibacter sp. HDW7]
MTTTQALPTAAAPAPPTSTRLRRLPAARPAPPRLLTGVAALSSLGVLVTGVSLLATRWRAALGSDATAADGAAWTEGSSLWALVLPAAGLLWMVAAIWVARTRPVVAAGMALLVIVPPLTVEFVDIAWWGAAVAAALVGGLAAARRSWVPLATASGLAVVGTLAAALGGRSDLGAPAWLVAPGGALSPVRDAVVGYVLPVAVVAVVILTVRALLDAWAARDASVAAATRAESRRLDDGRRAEIARDLHDVAAHHLSLVAVRAESLRYATPDLTARTRDELALVAEGARAALTELRRSLDLLAPDGHDAPLSPPPTALDLLSLVSGAQDAGQQIDAHLPADVDDLLARVHDRTGHALFRIAQECLTNARRHAPSAPVTLELSELDGMLRLTVSNPATATPGTTRRGLSGMWDRAAQVGGTAGTELVDGRFVVEVTLPLVPTDVP